MDKIAILLIYFWSIICDQLWYKMKSFPESKETAKMSMKLSWSFANLRLSIRSSVQIVNANITIYDGHSLPERSVLLKYFSDNDRLIFVLALVNCVRRTDLNDRLFDCLKPILILVFLCSLGLDRNDGWRETTSQETRVFRLFCVRNQHQTLRRSQFEPFLDGISFWLVYLRNRKHGSLDLRLRKAISTGLLLN